MCTIYAANHCAMNRFGEWCLYYLTVRNYVNMISPGAWIVYLTMCSSWCDSYYVTVMSVEADRFINPTSDMRL